MFRASVFGQQRSKGKRLRHILCRRYQAPDFNHKISNNNVH